CVRGCLEKNGAERFQWARGAASGLAALSSASGVKPMAEPDELPARHRRPGPAVAAAGALAIVAGATYVIGARFGARPADPPALTQLTFRSGTVGGARYSPDGKTVIYAAAWEGEPNTVFPPGRAAPDSSPLPLPPADVLSISPAGDMALLVNARHQGIVFSPTGTLARASISGGAARELAEGMNSADWSPDGSDLV